MIGGGINPASLPEWLKDTLRSPAVKQWLKYERERELDELRRTETVEDDFAGEYQGTYEFDRFDDGYGREL